MRTQVWVWAACLAGAVIIGCGGDSNGIKPSGIGECGDGVWNEGEDCDDGNLSNGDGCSSTCTEEVGFVCEENVCKLVEAGENCGNGVVDEGEACDDANTNGGDGCSANCLFVEDGYECKTAGAACSKKEIKPDPIIEKVVCGDGKVGEGEKCDDGNTDDGDGCSWECKVESGYECPEEGGACKLIPIAGGCGDGTLDDGEECDDNNRENGDGCAESCHLEPGWNCDDSGCHTTCGDGVIAGTETCDDANNDDGDGCSADCSTLEEGFECQEMGGMTYCMAWSCGNYQIEGAEECDEGDASREQDGTSYGWRDDVGKPYCFMCHYTGYCGDGKVNGDEECDEGLKTEGKPVGGDGTYGHCTKDCRFAAKCGDGLVQNEEECDNGLLNDGRYNGCKANCTHAGYCGDGIVDTENGEVCDEKLGYLLNTEKGVSEGGGTDTYGHCKADCSGYSELGFCGDGIVNGGEECDFGKDKNTGEYGGCNADCTFAAYCGDGKLDEDLGEVCDDGLGYLVNEETGKVEGGGTGAYGNNCLPNCSGRSGFCGDGLVAAGYEACDLGADKNTGEYGGCNEDCTLAPFCGDGNKDDNEQCDNGTYGNTGNYGGCKKDCTLAPHCGDANPDSPFEKCDNGSANKDGGYTLNASNDNCTVACSFGSYCGDGIVDSAHGEECDDGTYGNSGTYGGCTNNCKMAARCGDGNVDKNAGEECDSGNANAVSGYGTCNSSTCTWNAICGDGHIDTANGEQCDDGLIDKNGNPVGGDGSYGGCMPNCHKAGYCGDGKYDAQNEDCDGITGCTAACTAADGYECKNNVCTLIPCGNGKVDADEECDDGIAAHAAFCRNCSALSGYVCKNSEPYGCPTSIPNKYCAVAGVECIQISDLFGDGIVSEGFEECDDNNTVDNDGCTKGRVDPGYVCLTPGEHCYARACGDGILAYGEECDDGNAVSGDGCSARCKLEEEFRCETVGNKSVCVKGGGCGDGIVQHGEECDDGGVNGGCSPTCKLEPGYECPSAGGACKKVTCGNNIVDQDDGYNSYEQCDLGANNGKTGFGCTVQCRIAAGYHCNDDGTACYAGVCGDGNVDAGEECDDGNLNSGDGCNAACQIETVFEQTVDGSYKPICGDGITVWDAGEECDDGNLVSGDGCSAQCTIEYGWKCTEHSDKYPQKIQLPVTYRDFRAYFSTYTSDNRGTLNTNCKNATANNPVDGCINSSMVSLYGDNFKEKAGHPDFERINRSAVGAGLVENTLGSDGLPVWQKDSRGTGITANSFDMWYRDYPGINKTIKQNLTLNLTNDANGTYTFESSSFFPLDGLGYGNESRTHNYHFTSHIRTFFKFRGNNERLDFTGDDDVFVFVNGTQAIDLGGCHSPENASFNLDSTNQTKTVNGVTYRYKYNDKYDLYEDGIYAIDFFQAERKTDGSNFKLTLAGFLDMGTSTCETVCGDGILAGDEQCESTDASGNLLATSAGGKFRNGCTSSCTNTSCGNGSLDTWEQCDYVGDNPKYQQASYGTGNYSCNSNTCRVQYCGDGIVDLLLGEQCDAGAKNGGSECTINCELPKCGDGIVTKEAGEECDNGTKNSDTAYGEGACTSECKKAPYCGDGIIDKDNGEVCDNGKANNDNAYGDNSCTTKCQRGGYCGDGKTNGREKCDSGTANNNGQYGGCNADCTMAPRCGDRIVDEGEECDNGAANNDNAYGANACLSNCTKAPYCGDGKTFEGREQCDNGNENSADAYGPKACTDKCMNAGYCGDGILNGSEKCDFGAENNKDGVYGGCSSKCTLNGYCGDGNIDEGYETCDNGVNDGSYGSCTSTCQKAPFCGDGIKNGNEACDFGADNNKDGVYGGCSSKCTLNGYCGDGIKNGNEACDKGVDGNDGAYGGCNKNCTNAPFCGDGIVNGTEEHPEACDRGANNNGAYNGCNADCTKASFCGDGHVDEPNEECDDGNNDGSYNGCMPNCRKADYCGDGIKNGPEECDYGKNNNGEYGSCNPDCTLAPYCGDGIVNGTEECDYALTSDGSCTKQCMNKIN